MQALEAKCRKGQQDAGGFYQAGSEKAIEAVFGLKGDKPSGSAVFFHAGLGEHPRLYANYNYHDGKWNGVVATWNVNGQREFWCKYTSGKRNGLCCLFENDLLAAVLECTQDKVEAVHLIEANEIGEDVDADVALDHALAGPVLRKIDAIEKQLKKESLAFVDRVTEERRKWIAWRNQLNREAGKARQADLYNRKTEQDKAMLRSSDFDERVSRSLHPSVPLPENPQKLDEDQRQHHDQVDAQGVQGDLDGARGLDAGHGAALVL